GDMIKLHSGQLDRKTYESVNKVLEAMGGKWNRKYGGHVFLERPEQQLLDLLSTGVIIPPQEFGFYPTPPALVAKMIELADLRPGMRVLEPSAGTGAIADMVGKIVGVPYITCIELLEKNVEVLRKKEFNTMHVDFLKIQPYVGDLAFDRVLMNPPFENQQDIDHVCHALNFLRHGGRLVSIMSPGFTFRENKKSAYFRSLVEDLGGWYSKNEPDAFKESGTGIQTVTVVIDRIKMQEVLQNKKPENLMQSML
ncbi:MAG: methyltransferase, partial [Dehalococcoidales bacterium]|nr:methyltransferase [Dehalococcoidales bacterium]